MIRRRGDTLFLLFFCVPLRSLLLCCELAFQSTVDIRLHVIHQKKCIERFFFDRQLDKIFGAMQFKISDRTRFWGMKKELRTRKNPVNDL
jgi:hypothetical protein